MDKKRRAGTARFNIGIASIICIFAVLGLTIFAVLSVSTASAEAKLADKYAASVTDYYAADRRCSDIACRFGALWESGADAQALRALAQELDASFESDGTEAQISYSVPIDGTQNLSVTLRLGASFRIERWQTENSGEWLPDTELNLWDGT